MANRKQALLVEFVHKVTPKCHASVHHVGRVRPHWRGYDVCVCNGNCFLVLRPGCSLPQFDFFHLRSCGGVTLAKFARVGVTPLHFYGIMSLRWTPYNVPACELLPTVVYSCLITLIEVDSNKGNLGELHYCH
jgi:hypothetical protein